MEESTSRRRSASNHESSIAISAAPANVFLPSAWAASISARPSSREIRASASSVLRSMEESHSWTIPGTTTTAKAKFAWAKP